MKLRRFGSHKFLFFITNSITNNNLKLIENRYWQRNYATVKSQRAEVLMVVSPTRAIIIIKQQLLLSDICIYWLRCPLVPKLILFLQKIELQKAYNLNKLFIFNLYHTTLPMYCIMRLSLQLWESDILIQIFLSKKCFMDSVLLIRHVVLYECSIHLISNFNRV